MLREGSDTRSPFDPDTSRAKNRETMMDPFSVGAGCAGLSFGFKLTVGGTSGAAFAATSAASATAAATAAATATTATACLLPACAVAAMGLAAWKLLDAFDAFNACDFDALHGEPVECAKTTKQAKKVRKLHQKCFRAKKSTSRKAFPAAQLPEGQNKRMLNRPNMELVLQEELGQGAFGTVHRGIFRREQVAVKVLPRDFFRSSEWDILSDLSMHRHPHILTIRNCFLINDTCYLVSELILGSDALDDYAEELRFQAAQIVQLARWEMKNCTPLWREAHFEVKMYKTPRVRATFGGSDVEKVHAVVARSTSEVKMYKTPHVRAKVRVQHFRFASPASCHIFLSL